MTPPGSFSADSTAGLIDAMSSGKCPGSTTLSLTTLTRARVPIDSSALKGLDALLSTVQMPPGVPVATVAIGKPGATNAGVLAAQMIALGDKAIAAKLEDYKKKMEAKVEAAAAKLAQS